MKVWLFLLASAVPYLHAAPMIGAVRTSPMTAAIGTPTPVTVTASITDPSLITGSVNLLQLNGDGTTTILGVLHDDGLNGDAFAGDLVFTFAAALNATTASQIQLQVSAAFRGSLLRVKSSILKVYFQPPDAAQQSVASLAGYLATGNTQAALQQFLDSDRAGSLLSGLGAAGLQKLAAAFSGAQLAASSPDMRIFTAPWISPTGSILNLEFTLEPDSNGNWLIVAW
jgi:hypothetical protein